MLRIGNILLACLLAIAGFSDYACATSPIDPEDPFLVLPPGSRPDSNTAQLPRDLGERKFSLRHIYHRGTHEYPDLHRYLDIPKDAELMVTYDGGATEERAPRELRTRAESTKIQRLKDRRHSTINSLLDHARDYGEAASLPSSAWTIDEVAGPNVTDKESVLNFAKMAANSYVTDPFTGNWQDVKRGFNFSQSFGWEEDGLRGHIYADEKNDTIVISLKGTTTAVFDGVDTTGNDKLNDNLFGSCCCAQGGRYLWKQVCDCMSSQYVCNSTCVTKALHKKSHYYYAVNDLYQNVTERYPHSDVWLTGHSLGGVVSSLLGLTYGLPVMTYEAYPDALAASRLGLPVPPGYSTGLHQSRANVPIYHYGHTADPVFMGVCNYASSLCTISGYAFESVCHTGSRCVYDTVGDLGWRVAVSTHSILNVIKDVLEKYDDVPVCKERTDCTDCYNWKFFESNGTESTTSKSSTSTSTRTRTRTETCKTPGWWGCLDESTTTDSTTTSTTSSSSSTTCETPGWFGCKDSTTTTDTTMTSSASPAPTITTTSQPTSTSTSTCETPGWFGCNDPTSTTSTTPKTSRPSSTSSPTPTHAPPIRRKHCVSRHWYGTCKKWKWEHIVPKSDL